MYKYKITLSNDEVFRFESKYHISTMSVMPVNGVSLLYFKDVEIGVNLAQAKEVEIDGTKYQLRAYTV